MFPTLKTLALSVLLASCGAETETPSAIVGSDPLSLPEATIGKTEFLCQASFSQFRGNHDQPLELSTTENKTHLAEDDLLIVQNLDFATSANGQSGSLADTFNINNIRLVAAFAKTSSLGCAEEESELMVTSTTVFADQERSSTISTGYCWNRNAHFIKVYHNIMPGPVRQATGSRAITVDDFDIAGLADKAATPAKFTLKCER